ncbi:3-oxoacyl-ACP synthase [Bizionia argentinensis JUB59]|uniref:3-oxoacyl-ACP synthase n=1 Tax=Bizionia argentinensis JUB59 TaxID=1046627 RepID=G2EFA1_9FLAO|nr:hypothetical protein [Bizionia argentinensis]EGV42882.1 3-oxoacyl-ACP synthase [Bizionia argentinensis JUB59]
MKPNYYITSYCQIKKQTVSLNGNVVFHDDSEGFTDFIKSVYKAEQTKYPKFFKMDNLSKLAFLAADILLKNEALNTEIENNIALVFSNRASSLDTDRLHQEAIQDKSNYFPSPAVFVYTLPNICLGEISIKYKLFSENSFFIFDGLNADLLATYTNSLLDLNKAEQVLCGWVDFDENHYEAFLYLVSKNGKIKHNKKHIKTLYNT